MAPKRVSKRSKTESYFASIAATALLIAVALPDGFKTKIGTVNLKNNSSVKEIRDAWGAADAGSILDIAITWAQFRPLDPINQYWIIHFWSPGMALLEIPLIWLASRGIPLFWSLLILTILLWAWIVWLSWRYISPLIGRLITGCIFFILLGSWDFFYIFRSAVFYTEGLSIGLLLMGLGILTFSLITQTMRVSKSIIVGLFLGFSLMLRYTNEMAVWIFFFASLFLYLWQIHRLTKFRENQKNFQTNNLAQDLNVIIASAAKYGMILISSTVSLATTLPWRIVHRFIYDGPFWSLSSNPKETGSRLWALDSQVSYWNSFGLNWACDIDKVKCMNLQDEITSDGNSFHLFAEAVISAFYNPFAFFMNRGEYLALNWIPGSFSMGHFLWSLMSIIPIFLLLIGIFISRSYWKFSQGSWIISIFILLQVFQLLFMHYESRYFITIRMFSLFVFIFSLAAKQFRKLIAPV